ncbi:MAG TPA: transglycosylase domain-containing protein, partial [Spirochaetia bacterium]|nr:transglycosylase domain-containing protein [Spirochaetia bacterium]
MRPTSRRRLVSGLLIALSVCTAVGFGVGVGAAIAKTDSLPQAMDIGQSHTSLPTQILDRNGKLIGEYSGAANHQVIPLDKLPKYLILALLTREDQNFFHEGAFSLRGTVRAAYNIAAGRYFSGGSTITQQLAGLLYANRSDKT